MFSYDQNAFNDAITCSSKASSSLETIGNYLNNLRSSVDLSALSCSNSSLTSKLNSINDSINASKLNYLNYNIENAGSNPFDAISLPNKLKSIKEKFDYLLSKDASSCDDLTEEERKLLQSMSGKYNENSSSDFTLWLSKYKYTDEDFANSKFVKENGLTVEQAKELFLAVCIAESDKSLDDTLAVATVALNRCESSNWSNYYDNGTNPIDQMFANNGLQYETIINGNYKNYCPSIVGLEQVEEYISAHDKGTTYEDLYDAVINDAVESGVRNNDYTGFRANCYGYSNNKITTNGNEYGYENPDKDYAEAMQKKEARNNGTYDTVTLEDYQDAFDDILTSTDNKTKVTLLDENNNTKTEVTNLDTKSTDNNTNTDSNSNKTSADTTTKTDKTKDTSTKTDTNTKTYDYSGGSGSYYTGGSSSTETKNTYTLVIKYVYEHNPLVTVFTESKVVTEGTAYNYTPRAVSYYYANPTIITGVMPSSNYEVLVTYMPLVDTNGNGKADEEENLVSYNTNTETQKEVVNNYYYTSDNNTTETVADTLENVVEEVPVIEPVVEEVIDTPVVELTPEIHPGASAGFTSTTTKNSTNILPIVGAVAGVGAAAAIGKVLYDKSKADEEDEYN